MSGFDIFAWIVLIILIACAVGVFCIAGWLPGHIAKSRGHPWAEAVTVAVPTGKVARAGAWARAAGCSPKLSKMAHTAMRNVFITSRN